MAGTILRLASPPDSWHSTPKLLVGMCARPIATSSGDAADVADTSDCVG